MRPSRIALVLAAGLGMMAADALQWPSYGAGPSRVAAPSGERHLAHIRQLTFGRKNAEAYFSFDGTKLIFQSTNEWDETHTSTRQPTDRALGCYQIYVMDLHGENVRRVSTGVGKTTCGYFLPGDRRVLFSSTHLLSPSCPPEPRRDGPYRWPLDEYDIFSVKVDGQQMQRLTTTPGYDAEATVSPDGKTIVFTSMRDGDLDLYAMDLDGSHLRRLTHEIGYDGGAFFSPDSRRLVYRASHPSTAEELDRYRTLLAQHLVEPGQLEIFVMDADGSHARQVTATGASNFAPSFHPDGRHIIFSSSVRPAGAAPPSGRPAFHLHLIADDGTGLEPITSEGQFNSFPMFSPDGTKLVWISDRHAAAPGEFNVFIADWVP
jgi:Tol biopolymer transport system component